MALAGFIQRAGSRLEGAALLGLALFIARLLWTDRYWMYLNPQYALLTGSAATLLGVLGVYALLRRRSRVSWPRLALFAVFLGMLWSGAGERFYTSRGPDNAAFLGGMAPPKRGALTGGHVPPDPERDASRLTRNGKEYLKLNTAELVDLLKRPAPHDLERGYALRGALLQGDILAKRGEWGLFRIAVQCCFADAVAVGVRVKGVPPPEFKPGAWVQVVGRLEPSNPDRELRQLMVNGAFSTLIEENYTLVAEEIRILEQNEEERSEVFLFEIRGKEPYAY
jgi:hypothetical protein